MGIVYQLTFFLALGLLATVVAIFVFAVSLLGRAMEAAAKDERNKIAERKAINSREIATLRKGMRKAEKEGEIPRELKRKLGKLEDKDKKFDKELSKIRKAPELLTVRGGVIHPGIFVFASIVFTVTASYLSTIQNFNWLTPLFIWLLGLAAIGYSVYRICKSLKVIESVAITSEEAWIVKTVEAFKIAQKELEEEKKPRLELKFEDAHPPFRVEAGAEITIRFNVGLTKGDVARNPVVAVSAPPGFKFPDSQARLPTRYEKYANYVSTRLDLGDIIRPLGRRVSFKLKVPSQPRRYIAVYRLYCEGFYSKYEEFEIIVKKSPNIPS